MSYSSISVRRSSPHIGAEIEGVDITQPLGPTQVRELSDALAEFQVLFLRDQKFTLDSQKAFGRLFGELHIHPNSPGPEGHPEILRIHADAQSKRVAGERWHSDVSCDPEPPLGGILHLHTVPPSGGDTLFASMYAAYDALSPRLKVYLEGLTAEHDGDHVYRPLFPDLDRRYPCNTHPVIRTHPVTGRKGIFVNSSYVTHIVEVGKEESDAILRYLYQHCANPNFHVRFKWEANSVAFWDNRCTQHLAVWDYYPAVRSGFRVTVAGDKPF